MSIIVGYVPTPEGEAALEHAVTEARKSQKLLVVITSSCSRSVATMQQARSCRRPRSTVRT